MERGFVDIVDIDYVDADNETVDALDNEALITEQEDVGSFNHSIAQSNCSYVFKRIGTYSVSTDLSLNLAGVDLKKYDIKLRDEIKPDICLYPKRKMNPAFDIIRMSEMPLLVVEIVSPKQGFYEILEKFKIYFDLGIHSCWLINPPTLTVTVYSSINQFQSFVNGDIVDSVTGIRVALEDMFD